MSKDTQSSFGIHGGLIPGLTRPHCQGYQNIQMIKSLIQIKWRILPLTYTHPPSFSEGKATACNAGDLGSIPGWGRSPEEGNGNPLQLSRLENPMDRGASWATVHGVTKESDTA